jgi:crotonobetainyl-CoA:carnitine CoA-transferase CaiB-like acyl-CoA transferase
MTGRPSLPPFTPRDPRAPKALDGLRVVDFTQMLSGPYSTQQLADYGAEVIKIEAPVRGDDSRHYTTTELAGECAFFLSINRGKRSITLDLKSAAGREVALRLIAEADILVENFSNGVMDRLGLGYAAASELNPMLIYCSVSGYGRDEPSVPARRSYDAMAQSGSGLLSLTGERDRPPMRTTVPIVDLVTAMTATSTILAAVIARERLRTGQFVEVCLQDVAVASLTMYGMAYLVSGSEMPRSGNRAPQTSPSDMYAAKDGQIFLTCGNNRLFSRLCQDGISQPELLADPDFASNDTRVANVERLTRILSAAFSQEPRDYWVERLSRIGVPVSAVLTIGEAMASADVRRRNMLGEVPHPKAGTVPNIRAPFSMSVTPAADPVAPPLLGQHTADILADLGYGVHEVADLVSRGAFGAAGAGD